MLKSACLLFTILTALLINSSCSQPGSSSSSKDPYLILNDTLPKYDLGSPAEKYSLLNELDEISGLTYYKNDIVACVQDEKGRIFFYDLSKREVVHTIDFWKKGDYEGIEVVDTVIYIVKSNGDLYQLAFDMNTNKQKANEIETEFTQPNDIESLGYDPSTNSLIIITKNEGGIDEDLENGSRGVYNFNLSAQQLNLKPQFIIANKQRVNFYKEKKPENKYNARRMLFRPSGMAVHPQSGNYYILASVGKILLVTTPEGEILESHPIKASLLKQPEGICFAPDGTMYISSEGDGGHGYILKYDMIK